MLRLIFARHAQSSANRERVFSERGWEHPLAPPGGLWVVGGWSPPG